MYATGKSPAGPWDFRGVIMDKNDGVKTIHQAIIDLEGVQILIGVSFHDGHT